MKIFEPIYTTILQWAKHPKAEKLLGLVSFSESSFFPIPVDVMLAPMVLADKAKAWRLATIATITSVLGGVFGYFIGFVFFDTYGDQLLSYFNARDKFTAVQAAYADKGIIIVFLASFTPLPYKIVTIASGVLGVALLPFIVMSLIGRGMRFFLVAGLIRLGGDQLEETIHRKIEIIGWGTLVVVALALGAYFQFR